MFLASISSLSHLRSVFVDRVIPFGETLGDQVKGRSPKNLESLIEVPNVVLVKVQVLSFNVILFTAPELVPRPRYQFQRILGVSRKWPNTQPAGIVT